MTLFADSDDFFKIKEQTIVKKMLDKHAGKLRFFLRFGSIIIVCNQLFGYVIISSNIFTLTYLYKKLHFVNDFLIK